MSKSRILSGLVSDTGALANGTLTIDDIGAQAALVSGTNIKTINGTSVLGSGNIQIDGGVTSFNTRTGAVTLSSSDVTAALGFTPYNSTNPSGYITSSALSTYLTSTSAASIYLALAGGTLTGASTVSVATWAKWTLETTGTTAKARQGSDGNGLNFTSNALWNGAWVEDDTTKKKFAYIQHLGNGRHEFRTAASGTGISWSTSLTIDEAAVNSSVALQQAGNQVLHAGNYSSYALPLSGGTLTGGIVINGGASNQTNDATLYVTASNSNDWGIRIEKTSADYGLLTELASGAVYGLRIMFGGAERFRIGDSAQTISGNQILHAGNYTGYSSIIRALGAPSSSTDWNSLGNTYVNSIIQITPDNFSNTANGPTAASYTYGTLLNFSAQSSTQAQIFISHAGNDLIFRGGWNGASWQTWNKVLTNQNYSSYALPLSGGTLTGALIVNAGSGYPLTLTSNGRYQLWIKNTSATAQTFGWWLAHDNSGALVIHADSAGDRWSLDPSGHMTLSGRIRMGVFSSSTSNTGEAWIGRASDRSTGTMTVQLGNSADRTFEVVDNAWSTVIFNAGMNSFTYKGSTILHAGNYNYYALPLSGGTLSGSLSISGSDTMPRSFYIEEWAGATTYGGGFSYDSVADHAYLFTRNGSSTDIKALIISRGSNSITVPGQIIVPVGNGGSGYDAIRIQGTGNYESLGLGTVGGYGGMIRSYGNDLNYYAGHWRNPGSASSEDHSHYWYTSKSGSTNWDTWKMRLDHNANLTATGTIRSPIFYTGANQYWKSRGNSGDTEWTLEYSTSEALSDSNIKFRVYSSGNALLAGTFTESSTRRIKKNIRPITNALEAVNKLQGVLYDRIDGSAQDEPGLIAEDTLEIIKNLVVFDDEGQPAGIKYTKTIAYLIEAVKELTAKINILETK